MTRKTPKRETAKPVEVPHYSENTSIKSLQKLLEIFKFEALKIQKHSKDNKHGAHNTATAHSYLQNFQTFSIFAPLLEGHKQTKRQKKLQFRVHDTSIKGKHAP